MKHIQFLPVVIVAFGWFALPAGAGVLVQTNNIHWYSTYGIQNTFGSSGSGLYFGYTSDPSIAHFRGLIPSAPKFPNVNFNDAGLVLATVTDWPPELNDSIEYINNGSIEAVAEVPFGTMLTFSESDPSGWTTYSTLYREVNGVQTPFEEFRPLLGDGPEHYTLNELGTVDLVRFQFYTGGIYPEPGAPAFPILVHINVVPEPATIGCFGLGLGLLLGLRGGRGSVG